MTPSSFSAHTLRYGFEAAGLRLVPGAGVLTEMVADARVFPVPRSASALAGVLNLRGTIVPLFDPLRLGHATADIRPGVKRALVFDRDEQRLGLLLDAAPEPVTLLPAPADTPCPAGVLADYLTRAWQQADRADRLWWEIDHRAAFSMLAQHSAGPTDVNPIAGAAPALFEETSP